MHKNSQINKNLTIKQQKFCDEMLKTGDSKIAAKKAGYSESYATTATNILLDKPAVDLYLRKQRDKISAQGIASAEWKLKKLEEIIMMRELDDNENARVAMSAISESNKMLGHYAATKVESVNVNIDADIENVRSKIREYERDY